MIWQRFVSASHLKGWIPPRCYEILDFIKRGRSGLTRLYPNWHAACTDAGTYNNSDILEKVNSATRRAVASNGREFERDGFLFDGPITPFPLVACLLRVATANGGNLVVADFGGSLGSSFYQCREFLSGLRKLRWLVVDQAQFVQCGRKSFQQENLRFYETLEEAATEAAPDVVLFSGVLQYLNDPYDILARAAALRPRAIIIDRNPESTRKTDVFTVQIVPEDIYQARLPFRIFGAGNVDAHLVGYRQTFGFAAVDPDMRTGYLTVKFRGALHERVE